MVEAGQCSYHPERHAVGVCVRCGRVVCTECSTRLDGINHCAVCVAGLADARDAGRGPLAMGWVVAGLVVAGAWTTACAYAVMHIMALW